MSDNTLPDVYQVHDDANRDRTLWMQIEETGYGPPHQRLSRRAN